MVDVYSICIQQLKLAGLKDFVQMKIQTGNCYSTKCYL